MLATEIVLEVEALTGSSFLINCTPVVMFFIYS